jgi:hypothetical protein
VPSGVLDPRLQKAATRSIARLVIRLGSLDARRYPNRARFRRTTDGRPSSFDIHTFVTDEEQYEALKASFEDAGFRPPLARYVELRDRRSPGGSDPYELISRIGAERDRSWAILTHQDVRADQGVGVEDLVSALEHLDDLDPRWVVAGNAGGAPDLQLIRRLRDPYGGGTGHDLPARVVSLDENFLVFNRRHRPRCSPGLEGFHFYGTDACLNARRDGGTSYVIDFPVTHLSPGSLGPAYDEAKARFLAVWQRRMLFTYLCAPTEILFISRSAFLRRIFGSSRMHDWIQDVVPPQRLEAG